MGLKELGAYLKAEKECLKCIVSEHSDQPTPTDVESSVVKSRLEGILRRVRRQQLEEEIRFIEQNVLVKGVLVYDAASSIGSNPSGDK